MYAHRRQPWEATSNRTPADPELHSLFLHLPAAGPIRGSWDPRQHSHHPRLGHGGVTSRPGESHRGMQAHSLREAVARGQARGVTIHCHCRWETPAEGGCAPHSWWRALVGLWHAPGAPAHRGAWVVSGGAGCLHDPRRLCRGGGRGSLRLEAALHVGKLIAQVAKLGSEDCLLGVRRRRCGRRALGRVPCVGGRGSGSVAERGPRGTDGHACC